MLSESEKRNALELIHSVYNGTRTAANAIFAIANQSVFKADRTTYFLDICHSGEEQLRAKYNLGPKRLADNPTLATWMSHKSKARNALQRGFDPRRFQTFHQFVKGKSFYTNKEVLKARWNRWLNHLNSGEPEIPGLKEGIDWMRNAYHHRSIRDDSTQSARAVESTDSNTRQRSGNGSISKEAG